MLAHIRSAAVLGIDAYLVDVEADIANGLPTFATVGLPHGAVKEGRERVGAAIANSAFEFPLKRITVNLAPAYLSDRLKARAARSGSRCDGACPPRRRLAKASPARGASCR